MNDEPFSCGEENTSVMLYVIKRVKILFQVFGRRLVITVKCVMIGFKFSLLLSRRLKSFSVMACANQKEPPPRKRKIRAHFNLESIVTEIKMTTKRIHEKQYARCFLNHREKQIPTT